MGLEGLVGVSQGVLDPGGVRELGMFTKKSVIHERTNR